MFEKIENYFFLKVTLFSFFKKPLKKLKTDFFEFWLFLKNYSNI